MNKVVENVVRVVSHEEHVIESHISEETTTKIEGKAGRPAEGETLGRLLTFKEETLILKSRPHVRTIERKMYSMDSDSSENLKLDYQRSEATGVSDTPSDGSSSRERRRTSVLHAIETELEAFEARSNDLTSAPTIDEVGSLNEVERIRAKMRI